MNKWRPWVNMITVPIIALGAVATFSKPSKANSVEVSCQANASTPKVIVTLSKEGTAKDYPILNFLPEYFSPQDVVQSCQKAAKGLQAIYDAGSSMYLTSDKLNEQSVVCVVERRGIGCNHYSAQILFNFQPTDNPSQALYEMLGSDFKQAQRPDARTVSRTYTDTRPAILRFWPF
ncbi:hypothetical protein H6G76_04810 [Nostoc sp. FACHB-152]|uniref:COP23 domain-containing protein n=1 Tax=unclassified Nostoc TaxID=2593658 RepID=UPI00168A222C|nr:MULTISPECIES: COP23 domain-containing protein [unclassified Nostoc]MBD2446489.1 hypothetical protein [Nostoc sp. FACHB-152]MBD2468714.1 hypothetical protein [Nostoc sp. FACHB-145]